MMSLAHGKVSESAARMTLAKQMIKVVEAHRLTGFPSASGPQLSTSLLLQSVEAHAQTNSAMNTGPDVAAKVNTIAAC